MLQYRKSGFESYAYVQILVYRVGHRGSERIPCLWSRVLRFLARKPQALPNLTFEILLCGVILAFGPSQSPYYYQHDRSTLHGVVTLQGTLVHRYTRNTLSGKERTTIYEPLTRNESISLLTALTSRSVDSDSNLEGPESEPQLNQGASCPPARLPRPLSLQQAWQVFVREGTSSTGGQLLKPRTPRAPLKLQSLTNKFQNLLSHD